MTRTAHVLVVAALGLALASSAAAAPLGAQVMRSPDASPNATVVQGCNTPILKYSNGALIQNAKIFDVFYNQGNQYKDMLASFYTAITQSAHFDWLSEYNAGNYKIGRGSFAGTFEDTKSATTKVTLSDSQVQSWLSGLIDGGKVVAPDANTLYMLYFPAPVTISSGGSSSCVEFCAYHSSYTHNSKKIRYAIMPDVTTGGCSMGCGPGTAFQNTTDVSSHEMIEAITDPDGGSGWYDTVDNGCGEIGDICATGQSETGVVAGYTVQKEWSNKNSDCIVVDPNVVINDFTVAATPTTVNVPAGGMATVAITLTKTAGAAENVALSVTAPTSLPSSFSPASATSAGGTSTLTIMASPTATVGMNKLTVKATGSSSMPTVDITVNVVEAPDMAQPPAGGSGGTGGGGSGGTGGGGSGGTGTGGNGNGGGNGNNGGDSGCSISGSNIAGTWAVAALVLLALAFRRRRA